MRKKILIFNTYFFPSFKGGGPVLSIKNIIDNLKTHFDFAIICRDRDRGDPKPYSQVELYKAYQVNYIILNLRYLFNLKKIIKNDGIDCYYFNSFFSFAFSIIPLLLINLKILPKKPVLIAPRGEFSYGALRIKKNRKKFFIFFAKIFKFYRHVTWHITSQMELNDLQKIMGFNIHVNHSANIVNSSVATINPTLQIKEQGLLRMIYLSRITRKKNLQFALQSLLTINENIQFDIYGPIDDVSYWKQCQKIITKLPQTVRVIYHGIAKPKDVLTILQGYHLFYLPTSGENFGHVIFESITAGCPVLISDNTPWTHLITQGAGFCYELNNIALFQQTIDYFVKMSQKEFGHFRQNCYAYSKKYIAEDQAVEAHREMFTQLMSSDSYSVV